jgi:hypothetical protein
MAETDKQRYEILKVMDNMSASRKMKTIKGKSSAEMTVDRLNRNLKDEEKRAGWSYILHEIKIDDPSETKTPKPKKSGNGRKRTRRVGQART